MRKALLPVLFAAAALAAEPPQKPRCNAANQSRFWPEEANRDPKTLRKLAQSGDLEICVYGTWKYKWQPVSVNAYRASRKTASGVTSPRKEPSRSRSSAPLQAQD